MRLPVLAAVVVVLCGAGPCQQEKREFRPSPADLAETDEKVALSTITAGPAAPVVETSGKGQEFESNAYHLSQGKTLFKWFNCNGCHANGGGDSGPPLMDDRWIYGGSIENRARLFVEVLQAMLESWSPDRVGVRIAPIGHAYGAWDSNPEPLFTYVVERMNDLKIGWMDMVEGDTGISRTAEPSFDLSKLRKLFKGVTIANNLYTRDLAIEARRTNSADMIAFSRAYISNPDLVERLRQNAPLNDPDLRTFYSGGPKGYIDYPALA